MHHLCTEQKVYNELKDRKGFVKSKCTEMEKTYLFFKPDKKLTEEWKWFALIIQWGKVSHTEQVYMHQEWKLMKWEMTDWNVCFAKIPGTVTYSKNKKSKNSHSDSCLIFLLWAFYIPGNTKTFVNVLDG